MIFALHSQHEYRGQKAQCDDTQVTSAFLSSETTTVCKFSMTYLLILLAYSLAVTPHCTPEYFLRKLVLLTVLSCSQMSRTNCSLIADSMSSTPLDSDMDRLFTHMDIIEECRLERALQLEAPLHVHPPELQGLGEFYVHYRLVQC